MRLYEHEAKKVFASHGIPVPTLYGVVRSPGGFDALEASVRYPVMLKSLVLVGGRGKAGGIKKAGDAAEARALLEGLFSLSIKGYPVESVALEAAVESRGACYVGATMDPATFENVVMASASGGVDIEEVARTRPEAILKVEVGGNEAELPASDARRLGEFLAKGLGDAALAPALAGVVARVYAAYQATDAKVCEVNPLLITPQGPVAADAKLVLDDNALWRQSALLKDLGVAGARHDVAEPTANESRAREAGFKYVDLLPANLSKDPGKLYVGLVPGGAGYGIFSIDEVVNIGRRFAGGRAVPVNFMDSGGGPTQARVAEMFHLLMDDERVDVVITSRFGGISSCDVFIRGLVDALRKRHAEGRRMVPVHGRMVGTDLASARAFLEKAKKDTPEALAGLHLEAGNERIMADVIRDGLRAALDARGVGA